MSSHQKVEKQTRTIYVSPIENIKCNLEQRQKIFNHMKRHFTSGVLHLDYLYYDGDSKQCKSWPNLDVDVLESNVEFGNNDLKFPVIIKLKVVSEQISDEKLYKYLERAFSGQFFYCVDDYDENCDEISLVINYKIWIDNLEEQQALKSEYYSSEHEQMKQRLEELLKQSDKIHQEVNKLSQTIDHQEIISFFSEFKN